MGEADALALREQHAGLLRLHERRPRVTLGRAGLDEVRDARLRERRGREHDPLRGLRKLPHACRRELLEAGRQRQRPAHGRVRRRRVERPRDLQREERVAARGVGHSREQGARQRRSEPTVDEVVELGQRERPRHDALDAALRKRPREPERQLLAACRSASQEQAEPSRQPAGRERERSLGGRVEPLHVVDSDEHRAALRERREHPDEARRDRPRVGALVRLAPQQRRRQRPLLHGRQRIAQALEHVADEIGKRGEGEPSLALGRPRPQHAQPSRLGEPDRLQPDGRLADPSLSLDDERGRLVRERRKEPLDRRELRVAPDNLVAHPASRSTHGSYDAARAIHSPRSVAPDAGRGGQSDG